MAGRKRTRQFDRSDPRWRGVPPLSDELRAQQQAATALLAPFVTGMVGERAPRQAAPIRGWAVVRSAHVDDFAAGVVCELVVRVEAAGPGQFLAVHSTWRGDPDEFTASACARLQRRRDALLREILQAEPLCPRRDRWPSAAAKEAP